MEIKNIATEPHGKKSINPIIAINLTVGAPVPSINAVPGANRGETPLPQE